MAEAIFVAVNLMLSMVVSLTVNALTFFQIYYVLKNTTTLESMEIDQVSRFLRRNKQPPAPFPYDLGLWRNIKSFFGGNVLVWWFPMPRKGDGHSFATRFDEGYLLFQLDCDRVAATSIFRIASTTFSHKTSPFITKSNLDQGVVVRRSRIGLFRQQRKS